jgi:hypothetical protein
MRSAPGTSSGGYLVQAGSTSFLLDCGATTLASLQRLGYHSGHRYDPDQSPARRSLRGNSLSCSCTTRSRPAGGALRIAGPPAPRERVWSLFQAMYQDPGGSRSRCAGIHQMPPGVPRPSIRSGSSLFAFPIRNEVSLGLTVSRRAPNSLLGRYRMDRRVGGPIRKYGFIHLRVLLLRDPAAVPSRLSPFGRKQGISSVPDD